MEDMICSALSFLGLMSTLNGQHLNTAVYTYCISGRNFFGGKQLWVL